MDVIQKQNIIQDTVEYVKTCLEGNESGHDWWHIQRVWNTAKTITQTEQADLFVVELGALLHDIADSKFHNGDETIGPKKAREFLQRKSVPESIIHQVVAIIENISFKGGNFSTTYTSNELNVVQDADRLDALGAIGIARTFNYGGYKNNEIHNPNRKPNLHKTKEEYKKGGDSSINHFYEKLLLLKDRMNTETGKKMAEQRHAFMEQYLNQFYKEWDGER